MNWQCCAGCQSEQKPCRLWLVREFPLLNLAASGVQRGQLGGTDPLSCPYRGRGKLAGIVSKALKSFQVWGSPAFFGAPWTSCCSIHEGSELTDDSYCNPAVWGLWQRWQRWQKLCPGRQLVMVFLQCGWQMVAAPSLCSTWCKLPPWGEWTCEKAARQGSRAEPEKQVGCQD